MRRHEPPIEDDNTHYGTYVRLGLWGPSLIDQPLLVRFDELVSADTTPPPLFAAVVLAILTLASVAFMFVGLVGLSSEGSGPLFAIWILVVSMPFVILFGVLWAKVAEARKQTRLTVHASADSGDDGRA